MAISFIASVGAGCPPGGSGFTTGSIDTTGADFLVIAVGFLTTGVPSITDSKGNSWSALTKITTPLEPATQIFYSIPASVGASHTFTLTGAVTYAAMGVFAFSGVKQTSPFDVENGAFDDGSPTTIQPGSITPSENGELIITSLSGAVTSGASVDSGFSSVVGGYATGNGYSGHGSYLIQASAAAINPTWSWTGAYDAAVAIASFKAAASGLSIPVAMHNYRQRRA